MAQGIDVAVRRTGSGASARGFSTNRRSRTRR
jgi:hypothetical protein